MTTAVAPSATPLAIRRPSRAVDVLVVGGCLLAPLNLLIVRSLTAYDLLIGAALVLLLRQRRLQMPARRYLALSYVFLIAALVSAFRALYVGEALTQILQYAFVFFVQVPVVLTVVRTRRRAVVAVLLLCVGTLGAILHAYLTQPTQGSGRVLVFYSDNPNRLGYPAVYLLPLLLVLWHASLRSRLSVRLLSTVLVGFGVYLTVWALFASASRSSLVGAVVALVVYVVLRPGYRPVRTLRRAAGLCAVIALVGTGLVSTGQLPTTLEERITRSVNADADDRAGLVSDRENLTTAGLRAFVDSPYLGTGLDNFRYVTTNYNADATPQLPHNLWLQLAVQVGAFGTIAFGLYIVFWLRDSAHAFRRAVPPDAELLWGLVASLAGILTIFMFAPEMLDRHYWLIVALGLAVATGASRHRAGTRSTR
jgi:O-antigen ligase